MGPTCSKTAAKRIRSSESTSQTRVTLASRFIKTPIPIKSVLGKYSIFSARVNDSSGLVIPDQLGDAGIIYKVIVAIDKERRNTLGLHNDDAVSDV